MPEVKINNNGSWIDLPLPETSIDASPTSGSSNAVSSGGTYTALNNHISNQSNPHNVTAEQLGLSQALKFIGISTTPITDQGTEDPTIPGYSGQAKRVGNVVMYSGAEFVWASAVWNKLGDESAWQTKINTVGVLQGEGDGVVSAKTVDTSPTADSGNLVTSGGVAAALGTKVSTSTTVNGQALSQNIVVGSNRNLLDNGWFTINQRGQSSYSYPSQSGYTVDRWGIYDGTVTVNSGSITVATSNTCFFYQRIENYQKLYGKTITASVLDGDNVIHTGTIVASSSITNMIVASNFTLKFDPVDNGAITIFFSVGSLTLKAVKLELGSVSTLANDVAPDTASELAKCQYYFERKTIPSANIPLATALENGSALCQIPVAEKRLGESTTITMHDAGRFVATNPIRVFDGTSASGHLYGKNLLISISNSSIEMGMYGWIDSITVDLSADL